MGDGRTTSNEKVWMSRHEVAEYLGVSVRTIDRSDLPRSFIGRTPRFNREAVDRYLLENTITPKAIKITLPKSKPHTRSEKKSETQGDLKSRLNQILDRRPDC